MHILYIHDQKIEQNNHSGVVQKIKDKIKIWENEGVKVTVLSLYSFTFYNAKLEIIDDGRAFNIKKHGRWVTLFRLMYSTFLMFLFLGTKKFDLIYMRARPYMPLTRLALKKYKVVIELNTDDVLEYKALSRVMYYVNLYTRNCFYSLAHAFVAVSFEIANAYKNFNRTTLTIANGIEVNAYPFVLRTSNIRPKIIFVGSEGMPWHGVDKINKLAQLLPHFDFYLYGHSGSNTANLFFAGKVSLDKLKDEIKTADVAISTLSLYVNNMQEASPLKSRQYLAHGIPMIYAYDDTDIQEDAPFCLKISNTASNIEDSVSEIEAFIQKMFGNFEMRKMAREFAIEHLDVKAKELKRLAYLKSL